MVLVLTGAKLKFWLFPNLDNEKAGFFESFKPLYSVDWTKEKDKKKSKKKNSRKSDAVTSKPDADDGDDDTNSDDDLLTKKVDEENHNITENDVEISS